MSREPDSGRAGDAPVLTGKTLTYRVIRAFSALTFRILFRVRLEEGQHLPPSGGVLIVSNHQSYLDIPLLSISTRRHVSFVARDTLAETRWLAFVMRECGAVLIQRGKPDRRALREMVAHLEAGDVVSMFPEGTRSRDGRVQPFRKGALLAARMAGVPIVPAGIRGTLEAWPREAGRPRMRRVGIRFAAPVDSAAPDALERVQSAIESMVGDGRYASVPPSSWPPGSRTAGRTDASGEP